MQAARAIAAFALLCTYGSAVTALEAEWGEVQLSWKNRFSLGAGWRVQERDDSLLGKLNVPGQQDLCTPDDCLSFSGDPAPNERLKAAQGGFFLHNTDNGNLNYDRGDLYAAVAKLNSEATVNWDEWVFKASLVGFFDQANVDFADRHTNTRFQPAETGRAGDIYHRLAVRGEARALFAARTFMLGERELGVSAGRQRLRWGESNLHLLNTLDAVNPPDAVLARQPGLALNELNLPVGLLIVNGAITDSVAAEVFYQYEWRAVRPEPSGSFFSTSDIAGGGDYAVVTLGQFSEDPDRQFVSQGVTGDISSSTRTVLIPDERFGAPEDGGQYGVKLSWYADEINGGTEFGFYFANLHSRLPYLSALAADESCMRHSSDFASAFMDCEGFNGRLADEAGYPRGLEPLPVDTLRLFLEYPEDVRMFGVSFNTNIGGWSLAAEYAYRPNLPVQILFSDVVGAGVQPAFPEQDVPLNPTPASCGSMPAPLAARCQQFAIAATGFDPDTVIPGSRTAIPDYISRYRGIEIRPGDYIAGYERLKVGQLTVTGLKLFGSSNPFDADSILLVLEGGLSHIVDMPPEGRIYFQGGGDIAHPSPGADGSGDAPGAERKTNRLNPTQQREGFATKYAWGLRTLVQFTYENAWDLGVNVKPSLFWFEDIEGYSPYPMQNHIEDNQWFVVGSFFEIGKDWAASALYQVFRGDRNLLRDRDNVSVSLSYSF
ncbi:MAG: DUF1302 family protein [Gammaproteobacteria bacterium]|nr:DUF1302 family protein [Gammaproteobacteria bacterium]